MHEFTEIKILKKALYTFDQQKKNHGVHMDQAYISGIGLLLILASPEVVCIKDRKTSTVKTNIKSDFLEKQPSESARDQQCPRILWRVFLSWLKRIEHRPYKTPAYHPESNG